MTSSNYDGPITFKLNAINSSIIGQCSITVLLRQSAFPDMTSFNKNNHYKVCQFNSTNQYSCNLSISYPMSTTWYYLAVTSTCDYSVVVDSKQNCYTRTKLIGADNSNSSEVCSAISPPIDTFRFIGPTYFSVKYYFNSNYNRSNSVLIQNNDKPYFIEFLVDLSNNGGTLNFKLINNLVLDPGYKFDDSLSNASNYSKDYDFDLSNVKVMLKLCLLYDSMSTYKNCPRGYELSTLSYLNRYSNLAMNIPYPMMGKWYLAMWKECYDSNTE